jgi:Domain of unknown function (DUF4406)
MRLYISGPMHGYAGFNIPMFDRCGRAMRAAGFEVVSPSELDSPEYRARCLASPDGAQLPVGETTYGDLLGRDVRLIVDSADGLILLPRWERSRGARIEVATALFTGKAHWFVWHDEEESYTVHNRGQVAFALRGAIAP